MSYGCGVLKWFVCCILLLVLTGCSQHIKSLKNLSIHDADKVWSSYKHYVKKHDGTLGPYRLQARLIYTHTGKKYRSKVLIWGNGFFPLRLDILAGIGTVVAQIQEDYTTTIVYTPSEKEAIIYNSDNYFSFGMDSVPFRLYEILALVWGQYDRVFGNVKGKPLYVTPNGDIVYALSGGCIGGELTLSSEGLPIKWMDSTLGWSFELSYIKTEDLPDSLSLIGDRGSKLVFTIQSRDKVKDAFTKQSLELHLPQGTILQYAK